MWGCPYTGPIDPPPVQTNARPEIEVKSPTQTSDAIYSTEFDVIVEFEVVVTDVDTPANQIEYAWITDRGTPEESQKALGNNIEYYPLILASLEPGRTHTMTVRVKDGIGNGANEVFMLWEFEVQ